MVLRKTGKVEEPIDWLLKHSLNIQYKKKILKCIQKTNSGAEKENIAVEVISHYRIFFKFIFIIQNLL